MGPLGYNTWTKNEGTKIIKGAGDNYTTKQNYFRLLLMIVDSAFKEMMIRKLYRVVYRHHSIQRHSYASFYMPSAVSTRQVLFTLYKISYQVKGVAFKFRNVLRDFLSFSLRLRKAFQISFLLCDGKCLACHLVCPLRERNEVTDAKGFKSIWQEGSCPAWMV